MVKQNTPELDRLLKRLRAFTKTRGAIQSIADNLGVTRSTLSDWLRRRYEPGGEVTLKLQKWVIAAEAKKQKETPAVLLAQPGRVTRLAKSSINEKVQPDRSQGSHKQGRRARPRNH